jgi:hypothetical protein
VNGTLVCNPQTKTCAPPECTAQVPNCGLSGICLSQSGNQSNGACYPVCTPFGGGCSSNQECISASADDVSGACVSRGAGTVGAACSPSDVSTDCVANALCVKDQGSFVCRQRCNYFSSSPGCSLSERCAFGDTCSSESGDAAPLGGTCSGSSAAGERCGNDGKAWRGFCQGPGATCLKICRTSKTGDCGGGQVCTAFADASLAGTGYCSAPVGCSAQPKAQCQTCCGTSVAGGETTATEIYVAACGCQAGSTCNAACGSNYCAGGNATQACIDCLNGVPDSAPCIQQYATACQANATCAQYAGCLNQCPK